MIFEISVSSSRGPLPVNEDMVLLGDRLIRDEVVEERIELEPAADKFIVAVADGLGGSNAGDAASHMALSRLREVIQRIPPDLEPEEVTEVLQTWKAETHQALRAASDTTLGCQNMGTTVVGVLLCNRRAYRFHAGDSRLYRARDGALVQLTVDHSLRQQTGDASTPSHLLTNSLGGADDCWLEVQPLGGGIAAYDRWLLSTDGMHDSVPQQSIEAALLAERGIALRTLAKAAVTSGHDNCSIVVVDVLTTDAAFRLG